MRTILSVKYWPIVFLLMQVKNHWWIHVTLAQVTPTPLKIWHPKVPSTWMWLLLLLLCSCGNIIPLAAVITWMPTLTHWGRHKMAAVSQTTLSNAFSWMKMLEFRLRFHWSEPKGPKGPINNNPALFQVMAWRRPGDKPLCEPMMVYLLTHICITRPQWVNVYVIAQRDYVIFNVS